jgi:hypothetical protein
MGILAHVDVANPRRSQAVNTKREKTMRQQLAVSGLLRGVSSRTGQAVG